MKTTRLLALPALILAMACLTPAASAVGAPPPWAPAHGWRAKHHYVYYPSAQVYYEPASRMWFWFGGDNWEAGLSLPLALHGYVRTGGIGIDMETSRPYLRNTEVMRYYGGHRRAYWRHDRDDRDRYDRNHYDRNERDWDEHDRNKRHGHHRGRGNHGHRGRGHGNH